MRRLSLVAVVGLLLASILVTASPASAEGFESGTFPDRTFSVTRSPPGGPRSDTFTVDILPTRTGDWWVTAGSIAGSAVIVEVWKNDAGIPTLESSSKLQAAGAESGRTLLMGGLTYSASFTPFGKTGTSTLREHFMSPWIRQFGTSGFEWARGVAADASGAYVAGSTEGTLPGQTSAGGFRDAFVRKYDADGNEVWTRQFGTSGSDEAFAVAADASGVYVAGLTQGTLPGQTSAGGADAFLRKYDVSGAELSTRQFGTSGSDVAWAIAADASGVYVAGLTQGALPGQTSAGGFGDAFVRKYDADGNDVWTRQFGTSDIDEARAVTANASEVYVAGQTRGAFPDQTSEGGLDAFLRKYDASGMEVWTRQFGSSEADDARGVAANTSGVYIAGITQGALPGQTSAGGADAFLRKYDADGNEGWTRQFGTSGSDGVVAVAADLSGAYVAGSTTGTMPGHVSVGSGDVLVRKYDAFGTELSTRQFGTSGSDVAWAVAADRSGAYVAGSTTGTMPGQVSAGGPDVFLAKLAL